MKRKEKYYPQNSWVEYIGKMPAGRKELHPDLTRLQEQEWFKQALVWRKEEDIEIYDLMNKELSYSCLVFSFAKMLKSGDTIHVVEDTVFTEQSVDVLRAILTWTLKIKTIRTVEVSKKFLISIEFTDAQAHNLADQHNLTLNIISYDTN